MKQRSNANQEELEWIVEEPSELLKFLFAAMPSRSRKSVKDHLSHGQVFVNGEGTTQFNDPLEHGDHVKILPKIASKNVKIKGIKILHEDDDIVVIEKDAGILSIASDKEKQLTAYRQLATYLKEVNPKNRIFVVHRLDRETSGIMIFAKSKYIQQKLQNAWKEAVPERMYIALVEGKVKESGTITSWLTENKALIMRSSKNPNKGKKAVTHYEILKSDRNFTLLQVNLETGRKNQIRVHMQEIGHPIVGDKKYGSRINPIGRIGLHAHAMSFIHPTTKATMRFESAIPKSFTKKIN
ncbi:RluA family pseudouridine synthase [Salinicoccus siamensis]|uniref:Pseudouridine synthase n=1 Tax=Salinicoccus siamensis TaxID=381830 RepID=A0ABV5Z2V8_9STAP